MERGAIVKCNLWLRLAVLARGEHSPDRRMLRSIAGRLVLQTCVWSERARVYKREREF